MIDIEAEFEKHADDDLEFDCVQNKRSARRDLHALILLDSLVPSATPIVGAVEHDQIFINVDMEVLADKLTPELVVELLCCGVFYDQESLAMFV